MLSPKKAAAARREADRAHRALRDDLLRLREDAGASRSDLAREAGVDPAFLARIEDGRARPSLDPYARLGLALGADLGTHFYPNTGPRIRDRHQARMLETLLDRLHPRWRPYTEVRVRTPARGWIDVLLHDAAARCVLASEIESDLRRIEQNVRWFGAKLASLPSREGWSHLGEVTTRSRLLLVRSTRATRAIAGEFERQLAAADPDHPADAVAALTGTRTWPGDTLVWVDIRADRVAFVDHR